MVTLIVADAFPSFEIARPNGLRGRVYYASCCSCVWTFITDDAAELADQLAHHDHVAAVPVNGGEQLVML